MILIVAQTPVAGAVMATTQALRAHSDQEIVPFILANYPTNVFGLPNGAYGALKLWKKYLAELCGKADSILVHNSFEDEVLSTIFEAKRAGTPVFFQIHSSPLEAPAFSFLPLHKYDFAHSFVVAQGHGRFFQNDDVTPVPNIVRDFTPPIEIDRSNTIFIPHLRSQNTRWANKISSEDQAELKKTLSGKMFNSITVDGFFGRNAVTAGELRLALWSCKFLIDDLHTGLFHQTLIEGIKSGLVCFSGLDLYSMEEFCALNDAPPLPVISVTSMSDVCGYFTSSRANVLVKQAQEEVLEYAKCFLSHNRLAKIYSSKVLSYLE